MAKTLEQELAEIDEEICKLEGRRIDVINLLDGLSSRRVDAEGSSKSNVVQFPSATKIRVSKSNPDGHVW